MPKPGSSALGIATLLAAASGCNAILGLEDRTLSPDAALGQIDGTVASDGRGRDVVAAGDGCANTTRDPRNCGACGHDCAALPNVAQGVTCTHGACDVAAACLSGFGHCSTHADDGCETNLTTASNCGSCGKSCSAPTGVCTAPAGHGMASHDDGGSSPAYVCAAQCSAVTPKQCDDGSCVDTDVSLTNCGGCGNKCPAKENAQPVCAGGICTFTCDVGYAECSEGACTDLGSDTANCGKCGRACGATEVCASGSCEPGGLVVSTDLVLPPGTHAYASLTIQAGATLTTSGDTLDIAVSGPVRILGAIDVSGGAGGPGALISACGTGSIAGGGGAGGATGNPNAAGVAAGPCAAGSCTAAGGANGGGVAGAAAGGLGECFGGGDPYMLNTSGGANGGGAGGSACTDTSNPGVGVGGGGGGGFAGGGGGGYAIATPVKSAIPGGAGGSTTPDGGGAGAEEHGVGTPTAGQGGSAPGSYAGQAGSAGSCVSGGGGGSIGASAAADLPVSTTFQTGSAGGGGGGGAAVCPAGGGGGGGGAGGAVRITSTDSIAISGSVLANGGVGGAGSTGAGGGGGGSGGVVFLVAPMLSVLDGATLSAAGGAGAAGGKGCATSGGSGGLGRIRLSIGTCMASGKLDPPLPGAGCVPAGASPEKAYVAAYPK